MEQKDYVSYEVAKLLKKKGFDEGCLHKYEVGKKDDLISSMEYDNTYRMLHNSEICADEICAPSLYDAQKWLREKHNIHIAVGRSGDYVTDADGNIIDSWDFWCYSVFYVTNINNHIVDCKGEYETYEKALNDGIKEVLKHI